VRQVQVPVLVYQAKGKEMSISLMTYAWRIPCAENSDKLVLMKLCDHANDDGVCWPSWGHLVKHTGLSRATVARSLGRLEEAGILSRESRTGTSTMYTIHDEVMKSLTPVELRGHKSKGYQGETPVDPSHGETRGSHDETTTRLTVTPPPSHGETLIIKEPTNKPSVESDTRSRLAYCYKYWLKETKLKESLQSKKDFATRITPLLSRYVDDQLCRGFHWYVEDLGDLKYVSLRRFCEDHEKYVPQKRRVHWPQGIDKWSSEPVEEQERRLVKEYGEYR
jgi:DNA-binding transcriptional ArsR family regulator